ncbi:unnamed protein product, partial [Rotaria socialis]
DLDFIRQYAMYSSNEFQEDQPVEQALPYDSTQLSLHQASTGSIEYLLLNRALHAVYEYVDDTIQY